MSPILAQAAAAPARLPRYLGPVASRTMINNADGGPKNIQVMAQSQHILFEDLSYIEAWWAPTWRVSAEIGAEVARPVASTCRASIHYTGRDGKPQITRLTEVGTGAATATSAPGGFCKMSARVDARRGQRIRLRVFTDNPQGMVYGQQCADYANGDIFRYGETTPDLTGVATALSDTWQGNRDCYLPALILGYTTRHTVAIIGDSRDVGIRDVANDEYGCIGGLPRLLCNRVAIVNLSTAGAMASTFANEAGSARRRLLAAYASDVAIGLGVNDTIAQGFGAAETWAHIQAIVASLRKPAFYKTIDPWVAAGRDTSIYSTTNDPKRQALNALIRERPTFDGAKALETSDHLYADPLFVSPDGAHETNAGNIAASSKAGFDWAILGEPEPLPKVIP